MFFVGAHVSLAFDILDKPQNFVNDYTDTLSSEDRTSLENKVSNFEKQTSNEIAVVIISSLDGDTVENVAQSIFTKWGIGKKDKNNGILLLGDGTTTAKTGATIAFGVDGRANDNIHRWIENADVATGRTSPGSGKLFNWTTTTTDILVEGKASATLGGYRMTALGEDNASLETVMQFDSHGGTAPTAKTQAGGYGLIDFYAAEHDGANNIANITADGNVFSVSARVGSADITVFMVDEDGQGHLVNTTLVALSDDKDDAQMLRALDLSLVKAGKATGYVKSKYDDQIVYSEEDLVKYRILGDTIANGGLWCWSREVHLHRGAIWQNYTAIQDHAEILEAQAKRLALMEKQVKLLGKAA